MAITPDAIERALEDWDLPIPDADALQRLTVYAALLQMWNSKINLTAIRNEDGILHRHLMEGAFAASLMPAGVQTVLDFGSGGGIPGIPIAILKPELTITLAESSAKKSAFLREVARQIGLPITVHAERVEDAIREGGFDLVAMRAVDRFGLMLLPAARQLGCGGRLMLLVSLTQGLVLPRDVDRSLRAKFSWKRREFPGNRRGVALIGERVEDSPCETD